MRQPARQVRPGKAARLLGIHYRDLPHLPRPWTLGDVQQLRDKPPEWLQEARTRHDVTQTSQSEGASTVKLSELLTEYTDAVRQDDRTRASAILDGNYRITGPGGSVVVTNPDPAAEINSDSADRALKEPA